MSVKTDRLHFEQYQDMIARLYPELSNRNTDGTNKQQHGKNHVLSRTVTFQVTDYCNLKCFPAGTKIKINEHDTKNIEDISVGDTVLSFARCALDNTFNVTYESTKVVRLFSRLSNVRKITVSNGSSIITTDEHPFLKDNNEWVIAKDIKVGEKILQFPLEAVEIISNELLSDPMPVYNMETESHVYIANDFLVHNCSYCYQINKKTRMMSQETARKFVDLLLSGDKGFKDYVDPSFSPAIIIEFIGGEPFTNIDLIDYVCTYFYDRAIELHHPWAKRFMFSICSNGTLYFEPKVQKFLKKWKNNLSFSVTIDGDKELHDSCRVFPDGSGSYDLAVAAAKDWMSKGYYMGSKITIAPGNIDHVSHAIKHMVEMGYKEINCNCVYEKGWTQEHSTKLYYQLKEACQYLIDNNLEKDIYVSILEDTFFAPKVPSDTQTWCWGKGTPILTDKGYKPIEEMAVGDVVKTVQGNWKPVVKTSHHFADNCVAFSVKDNPTMVATYDHKLYGKFRALDGNFSEGDAEPYTIKELIEGKSGSDLLDREIGFVQTMDGLKLLLSVTAVDPQEVYNITVADDHSYFAGSLASKNCGGLGDMLSCDPDGYLYPCIRYMESSLGDDRPPIRIGHVDTGICQCEEEKCTLCEICGVTRRTYNTDECFFCPIAGGCADCAAYNYQDSGTVYHRATYICEMHKARCLVNAYYWAMFYAKYEPNKKFVLRMPDEWSLKIIPKEELDMLKSLPNVVFMPETWEQVRDGFAAQGIYKEYMINEHKEKAFEEKD